jgi:hypothetical protein
MASPVLRLSGWTVIGSDGTPLRSKRASSSPVGPGTVPPYTVGTTIRLAFLSSSIASAVVRACSVLESGCSRHALSRGPRRRDHRLAGLTGIWISVPDESLAGPQCYRRGWGNPTKQLKRNKLHEEVDKALVIVRPGTNLAAEDPIRPRRISDDHRQQKKRADEEKRLRAGCGGRIPQTD